MESLEQKNQNDVDVFFIRNNFKKSDEMRKLFFDNNQVAVHIDQPDEVEDYKLLRAEQERKNPKNPKTNFIERWFIINTSLKKNDVIIVSTYRDNDKNNEKYPIKIGLVPKGSTYFEFSDNPAYKVFQLSNAIRVEKKDTQIFSAIIPAQGTISRLLKRKNYVISKFNGTPLETVIENISEKSLELICLEWLRSDICPKEYKIKYQLLLTGGNYAKVDVYGHTYNGKSISAQVTNSNSTNMVEKKIEKLRTFSSDLRLMFCDDTTNKNREIPIISIKDVWSDLLNNGYKEMLEALINE